MSSADDLVASALRPPASGDVWAGLSAASLPVDEATRWVTRPNCGAVVTFLGTARDHSESRPGVRQLTYEAYHEEVVPRLERIAAEVGKRWPALGAVALLHRVGPLAVTEAAVVVAVSAPHRDDAFAAARFGIDTLKSTVPIWKKETWDGGESWGLEAQHVAEPESAANAAWGGSSGEQ